MGMPITIEIRDQNIARAEQAAQTAFEHLIGTDKRFSPFKDDSEVSAINRGGLQRKEYSVQMNEVLELAEATKQATGGWFDVWHKGQFDPCGIVKGWALQQVSQQLLCAGFEDFFVDGSGDVQTSGQDSDGPWRLGIRNPFAPQEVVKVIALDGQACATSGSYFLGDHIYRPLEIQPAASDESPEVVSLSIIAATVYEADRFATAAFAMGRVGIEFVEQTPGLEGYAIDAAGVATYTPGWKQYVVSA